MSSAPTLIEPTAEEFLRWLVVEKGRSSSTISAYRRDLNVFFDWRGARSVNLSDLTSTDFESFVNELNSRQRSPATIARVTASLRGYLRFCFDENHLDQDVSRFVPSARRPRGLPKPLGEAEVARILDAITGDDARSRRDRALLETLYATGARVSEVVSLRPGDLDFDEELILLTGKGNKQRLVPMGQMARESLTRYLEPSGRSQLVGSRRDSQLFVNVRGGPLSRQGVDLIISRRTLAAGLSRNGVSAHVFRHSCATHMLAHGADIRVVQELLGHASIATTQVYTAVAVRTLREEYRSAHPRAHD